MTLFLKLFSGKIFLKFSSSLCVYVCVYDFLHVHVCDIQFISAPQEMDLKQLAKHALFERESSCKAYCREFRKVSGEQNNLILQGNER